MKSFRQWVNATYWDGFDVDGLSDEEYYELEDAWYKYQEEELKKQGKWLDKEIRIS